MLKIISHKIAQTNTITPVNVQYLPAPKRWCAICGMPIINTGYIDHEGYAGQGTGAILCFDDANAALQSATQMTGTDTNNEVAPNEIIY